MQSELGSWKGTRALDACGGHVFPTDLFETPPAAPDIPGQKKPVRSPQMTTADDDTLPGSQQRKETLLANTLSSLHTDVTGYPAVTPHQLPLVTWGQVEGGMEAQGNRLLQ